MRMLLHKTIRAVRSGIVDIWNAFMLEGANFDVRDIPICPTTASHLPSQLISWPEAKRIHKRASRRGDSDYHVSAFIHFYVDDIKFDGLRSSIWLFPRRALEVIQHFDGVITPDFSMCQDFPEPLKLFAVYRMRAFGFWVGSLGIPVINNVRWGTSETWGYCFAGIPVESIVAVGTVASGLRKLENRTLFRDGFLEMIEVLKPKAIVVYGSSNYEFFRSIVERGIEVIQFDSDTAKAFAREVGNEQD